MNNSTAIVNNNIAIVNNNSNINWNEKYRPNNITSIILSKYNKLLIDNILAKNYFPNLLLYGPPGTGKTTTVMNLIETYLNKYYVYNRKQVIHLNASDERGIEIIRHNLPSFVVSDNLFFEGPKFIILDEVDYMTKTAQIALKYLIEYYSNYNVRYCLICNYITKIDSNLQTYFCKLKFNCVPLVYIYTFLNNICVNEKLNISNDYINYIIYLYNNDIRSMINHLQLHHTNCYIHNNTIYEQLYAINMKSDYKTYLKKFIYFEKKFNFDYNEFIKKYIYYVLKHYISDFNYEKIEAIEFFIHNYSKVNNKSNIINNLYNLLVVH